MAEEKIKPIRKLYRMLALVFPLAYVFLSKNFVASFVGIVLFIFIVLEILRNIDPGFNRLLFEKLHFLLKKKERGRVSASTLFLVSAFVTVFVFEKNIAIAALVFSTVGDGFAEIVGKTYGRHRLLGNKTIEGSAAFFLSAFFFGLIVMAMTGIDLKLMLIGAAAATLTELVTQKIDDNLVIPVVEGLVKTLFVNFVF